MIKKDIKLIVFLAFIFGMFFGTIINAEEVMLNTPFEEEIRLELPETIEDSHKLLIQIAELYWGERYDLEEITETLENNDLVLTNTKDELLIAQDDITILRKELETAIILNDSIFQLGIGYTYPNGVEILFEANIPNFFLGVYGRANIQFKGGYNFGIGLTIDL